MPRAGWMVVAAKEFGDHLLSARFIVLLIDPRPRRGGPALLPAAERSGALASQVERRTGALHRAVLARAAGRQRPDHAAVASGFLGLVAPLLGLAFAFDAVNGERAEGTLPRLLSQPIHRDDVINGKFAAGLAVIGLVLVAVVRHRRRRSG